MGGGRSGIDPSDLRALQAESRHQPSLAEENRIDILARGGGRETGGGAFVQDDDARARADLPAVAVFEILQRLVTHEEQSIAKLLGAGLQAIRCRHRVVIPNCLALLAQGAFAVLPANNEAGLDD